MAIGSLLRPSSLAGSAGTKAAKVATRAESLSPARAGWKAKVAVKPVTLDQVPGEHPTAAFRRLMSAAKSNGAAELNWQGTIFRADRGQKLPEVLLNGTKRAGREAADGLRKERVELRASDPALRPAGPAYVQPPVIDIPKLYAELNGDWAHLKRVQDFAVQRLTPAQYEALPKGTELYRLDGTLFRKGIDPLPKSPSREWLTVGVPRPSRELHLTPPGATKTREGSFAWSTLEHYFQGERSVLHVEQAVSRVINRSDIESLFGRITSHPQSAWMTPGAMRELAANAPTSHARVAWETLIDGMPQPKAKVITGRDGALRIDVKPRMENPVTPQAAAEVALQTARDRRQPVTITWPHGAVQIHPGDTSVEAFEAVTAAVRASINPSTLR